MNLSQVKQSKWSPWNWFRKEQEQEANTNVPVRQSNPVAGTPIGQLHREINRLFDDVFGQFDRPFAGLAGFGSGGLLRPQLDIVEGDDAYTVSIEIPGVERDDIDLSVQDRTLTISGEKRQEHNEERDGYHRIERSYGRFQRVLCLPDDADEAGIEASFKDGVLRLKLPRNTEFSRTAQRIAITS